MFVSHRLLFVEWL